MDKGIYYHFLSSKDAIDDLKIYGIKVSTLDTLNDPFEMMPYRRYGFKERQPYNRVFREISKKWGLLCFSQFRYEQLLWSHYAEGHKGIALGFEISKDKILKVKYTSKNMRTKFDLTDDPGENEKKFLNLAKIKYQEWGYEKEYRILLKLEDCTLDKGLYFMSFGDRLKIKEIILGCRFNKKDIKLISVLADKLNIKVKNRIATRPGWEDYKIHKCGTKTKNFRDC